MDRSAGTTTADNGGNFDPQQAAILLDQTTRQTRRLLEPYPPWLQLIRAIGALAIYGAIWLSVRDQHPYQHPTAAVVPVGIAFGILNFVATVAVARRATAGVRGRSQLRAGETITVLMLWLGVFVVMAILGSVGVNNAFSYGTYPAAVPLIVGGLAWAGITAARANWRGCASGLAVAVVGIVAIFAGPVGAWAVAGVGIFVELAVSAALTFSRQRRSVVRS